MKILVTGSNGQLGNELRLLSILDKQHQFIFTDIEELDITNQVSLDKFSNENPYDILINCAAYTAVDKAEQEPEKAKLINVDAVRNLVNISNKLDALFIHISTDYVFGGEGHQPYREENSTKPNSVYAKTKLGAEVEIENYCKRGIIIRTSWLYSSFGNNFVKTMIKYGKERESLKVVFDQIGSPTYAADLAKTILLMIDKLSEFNGVEVYHYSNEGVCSWYDFAISIMEEKNINCKIYPILTKDYPLPASRPFYSVLDKSKIKTNFGIEIPHWKTSLKECLIKI
jgi:dTDP-4-dehydrorhamnose reductase